MVFSSRVFLFEFLPAFLVCYFVLPPLFGARSGRARTMVLIAASYAFYGWARPAYCGLILFSTLVDFFCARGIAASGASSRRRRLLLVASIVTNLGLLAFFKYLGFFAEIIGAFAGDGAAKSPFELLLPVGISFYTFQSMSYTIDVHRGIVQPVKRFSDFMAYVSMFPQLVAGPIVRFRDIADQLVDRRHSFEKAGQGAFLFMIGFAKKTLIANNVGLFADALFKGTADPGLLDAWCGVVAYTMQIYFDFSGYSDMAIGLGLIIGFRFPINFDSPYRAASITEFWRRWHISLSTWLRDYLYVPLGGNRNGRSRTYFNLIITMLLGGLWHGAAWTFVLWGAWHGMLLASERVIGKRPFYAAAPLILRRSATFLLVMLGWVIFAATDMNGLLDVMRGILGLNGVGEFTLRLPRSQHLPLVALALACVVVFMRRNSQAIASRITWPWALFALVVYVLGVAQMLFSGFNPFLYFRF